MPAFRQEHSKISPVFLPDNLSQELLYTFVFRILKEVFRRSFLNDLAV